MLTNTKVTIFKRVRKGRDDVFVPHTFKAHFEINRYEYGK